MTIIYFVLVLGITVFIHELGHFLFAKKAKVHIYEFSLGMGPRLVKWNRKGDETIYSIRLLPIGGFVQMAGEEVEEDSTVPKEKQLQGKSWLRRFSIMIAGVLFNFLLAIILFFIIGLINGVPDNQPVIRSLDSDLPAFESGLQVGDLITKINGKMVRNSDRFLLELQVLNGEEIELIVIHGDGIEEGITITPEEVSEDGTTGYRYGFSLTNNIETGFLVSVKYGFTKVFSLLEQMVFIIGYLIIGKLSLNSLAGPIGIFNIVGEAARSGILNIVFLLAYISVNVGVINLLPIPAFDGGRILFLVIEKIKRRPISQKVENTIHSIGFFLLMALMLVITYNDIIRLFT